MHLSLRTPLVLSVLCFSCSGDENGGEAPPAGCEPNGFAERGFEFSCCDRPFCARSTIDDVACSVAPSGANAYRCSVGAAPPSPACVPSVVGFCCP